MCLTKLLCKFSFEWYYEFGKVMLWTLVCVIVQYIEITNMFFGFTAQKECGHLYELRDW